jgi:hypothetical protein
MSAVASYYPIVGNPKRQTNSNMMLTENMNCADEDRNLIHAAPETAGALRVRFRIALLHVTADNGHFGCGVDISLTTDRVRRLDFNHVFAVNAAILVTKPRYR